MSGRARPGAAGRGGAQDGDRCWKMAEVLVRGTNIKYVRIPEEVILTVPDEDPQVTRRPVTPRDGLM